MFKSRFFITSAGIASPILVIKCFMFYSSALANVLNVKAHSLSFRSIYFSAKMYGNRVFSFFNFWADPNALCDKVKRLSAMVTHSLFWRSFTEITNHYLPKINSNLTIPWIGAKKKALHFGGHAYRWMRTVYVLIKVFLTHNDEVYEIGKNVRNKNSRLSIMSLSVRSNFFGFTFWKCAHSFLSKSQ